MKTETALSFLPALFMFVIALGLLFDATGCAKLSNRIAAKGGLIGSYTGDYIIRNDSGGKIMDVWVLHNVMVQSVESGAGWLFRDQHGNPIHLGGDVKVIRVTDENRNVELLYHEYHAEFERMTYQELYATQHSFTSEVPYGR